MACSLASNCWEERRRQMVIVISSVCRRTCICMPSIYRYASKSQPIALHFLKIQNALLGRKPTQDALAWIQIKLIFLWENLRARTGEESAWELTKSVRLNSFTVWIDDPNRCPLTPSPHSTPPYRDYRKLKHRREPGIDLKEILQADSGELSMTRK